MLREHRARVPSSASQFDRGCESICASTRALFRSDQQLAILAMLFADSAADIPIVELARRAGVAKATASREVARLAEHGLVVKSILGRNTLVRQLGLPVGERASIHLVQTVGVIGRLSEALSTVDGVEEAYIFGSWAARYEGEAGPPPRDMTSQSSATQPCATYAVHAELPRKSFASISTLW